MAAAAWARVGVQVPFQHHRRLLPGLLEWHLGKISGTFQGEAYISVFAGMRTEEWGV